MRFYFALIALAVIFVISSGCVQPLDNIELKINSYSLSIPLADDGSIFNAKTMTSEFPAEIELVTGESVSVNGITLKKGEIVPVETGELAYDNYLNVESGGKRFSIRTLSTEIPEINIDGDMKEIDGDLYMTTLTGGAYAVKLSNDGEILYYIADEIAEDAEGLTNYYWDFKKHVTSDGQVRYSYHHITSDEDAFSFTGYTPGERVILDESYHELNRIKLLPGEYSDTPWLDGHDFILIDDNHYIVSAYILYTTEEDTTIVTSLLQEVSDGKVIFEFCAAAHPELYSLVPENAERIGDETIADFSNSLTTLPDTVHFNSMTIADDGNLICSYRHLSSIMKIDKSTGEILWILTNPEIELNNETYSSKDLLKSYNVITMPEGVKLSGQHYVRILDDGRISIFDNGNSLEAGTQCLILRIDEEALEVSNCISFSADKYGTSDACGSFQVFENGKALICWGMNVRFIFSVADLDITEPTGTVFKDLPSDADAVKIGTMMYRVQAF